LRTASLCLLAPWASSGSIGRELVVQEYLAKADKGGDEATKGGAAMVALIALGLVMLIWMLTWDRPGERPG
jgi:hypothetical protein